MRPSVATSASKPLGGAFSDYVNASGEALVKVDCAASVSFQSQGDPLRMIYT